MPPIHVTLFILAMRLRVALIVLAVLVLGVFLAFRVGSTGHGGPFAKDRGLLLPHPETGSPYLPIPPPRNGR